MTRPLSYSHWWTQSCRDKGKSNFRRRLFLECRSRFSQNKRRSQDNMRLRWRPYRKPDLFRCLYRQHGPYWSSTSRIWSTPDKLQNTTWYILALPQPNHARPTGRWYRLPIPFRYIFFHARTKVRRRKIQKRTKPEWLLARPRGNKNFTRQQILSCRRISSVLFWKTWHWVTNGQSLPESLNLSILNSYCDVLNSYKSFSIFLVLCRYKICNVRHLRITFCWHML